MFVFVASVDMAIFFGRFGWWMAPVRQISSRTSPIDGFSASNAATWRVPSAAII